MKTRRYSHQQPDAVVLIAPAPKQLENSASQLAAWVLAGVLAFTTGAGAMLTKPLEQMRPAIRPENLEAHVPIPPSLAARGFYQNIYR